MLRDSVNDPIHVGLLEKADHGLPGRIGLTIAPGKKDPERGWDRDLEVDLARLRDHYGVEVLVSLIEPHEYQFLQIPDLIERAVSFGMETHRLPIPDVSIPTKPAPAHTLVASILRAAEQGKTVLIHCRGGLGRSGLIAAACLVACGRAPDEAIACVRRARPGAVETREQEQWVRDFAAGTVKGPEEPALSRFRGCLLGGALGDALGYPIEFMSRADIERRFGSIAPEKLNYAGGELARISDDTQMTLFTAEGVLRATHRMRSRGICNPVAVIARAYLRWYQTQGDPDVSLDKNAGWLQRERALWSQRAPGNTCMSALSALDMNAPLSSIDRPPNNSKGCGAVMRVAPIGLAAASREAAFELARDASVLTHGHPSGYLSAAYFAALIWDLARGRGLAEAMPLAAALTRNERGHEELLAILDRAVALAKNGPPSAKDLEVLGGGWTGEEALAIALACALTADTSSVDGFRAALWRAAAHGGDSDSTAAICGNLLGAMGRAIILPSAWQRTLELREVIARIADDLHATMSGRAPIDGERYPPS